METYKIEITIDNLDFTSYTGIMSILKHMIENSKHEINVCDGKNADTSERQLTLPDVINRRELLVAFNKEMAELHCWFLPAEDSMIDEFLSNQ